MTYNLRGFTLLISLILTSVVLAVGVALIDIAVKQLQLSSSAKNSQYAFYNADSALECALYYDQKLNAFYYGESQTVPIECNTVSVFSPDSTGLGDYAENQNSSARTTTFNVPCADGSGINAQVTIIKQPSGTTDIYANGYNSCDSTNSLRIERGLKIHY
jgi:Tfp pilus assembly protein PilX